MDDRLVYFRVYQYLEDMGVQTPSRFELRKIGDGDVEIVSWGYQDIPQPDLKKLAIEAGTNTVMARENLRYVRKMRNEILAATDYLFLTDCVVADQVRIDTITFRQRLRDLPATLSNPADLMLSIAMFPQPPLVVASLITKYPQIFRNDVFNKRQRQ